MTVLIVGIILTKLELGPVAIGACGGESVMHGRAVFVWQRQLSITTEKAEGCDLVSMRTGIR